MANGTKTVGPVVAGVDGSKESLAALHHAVAEARWREVGLHVVHALDITPAVLHLKKDQRIDTRELAESDREEVWNVVRPIVDDSGVEVLLVDKDGPAAKTLIAYTEGVGASVLIVGATGRGAVRRLLMGSTAKQVLESARSDVMVVRPGS